MNTGPGKLARLPDVSEAGFRTGEGQTQQPQGSRMAQPQSSERRGGRIPGCHWRASVPDGARGLAGRHTQPREGHVS